MPESTFLLKEPNQKETTLIYLFFRFNNQKLKFSTGQKIKPRFWNPEKQRARESSLFNEAEKLNELLDKLSIGIINGYRKLINDNIPPTVDKLKNLANQIIFKNEYSQKTNLLQFINHLIETSNKMPATLKKWKHTKKKLEEFKKETNYQLDFDSINIDFYNQFNKFLFEKDYAQNTVAGYIKVLKIFMNEAVSRKLTNNFDFRDRKFKVQEEQVEKIYLSIQELKKIYEIDFNDNKKLERVRDLFIVGCYTGLRFSDLIQVKKENIISNGNHIRIRTEKTGEMVVIPLHSYVKNIINKYDGNLPPTISNQKMNDYLKEIAVIGNFNESIKISITRGGKLQHEVYKKSSLVSSHTARRSFATNAYLMDVPTISIMKITGHQTERAFMKYIRITQEENANKLLSHPFFN